MLAFIIASRWPLAPSHLHSFDSANFALAMENFNPALHQPQPPGYPLFVGLTRIIRFWVGRPEQALFIAGLLAACVSTVLILALGTELFGQTAGFLSAALLASNPVFWFGGVTNQIRVFLALIAMGIGLLAWRALRQPENSHWLLATFAALGAAAGFRPEGAALLVPLVLWVWWRTGRHWRCFIWGCALLAGTSLPWLTYTVWVMGGPRRVWGILWSYSASQFGGSSMAFGASSLAAWQMFRSAFAWEMLGALAWIWVLPLIPWRPFGGAIRTRLIFLVMAFLPSFLFSAFIHIGDPDQALASVAILCLAGGAALAAFLRRIHARRVFAASAAVLALQTLLFFVPPYHLARACSYRALADVDRMNTSALDAIADLHRDGPVTIVHYGSSVGSRQISFYFPDDYVNVLPGGPQVPQHRLDPMVFYHHRILTPVVRGAGMLHPESRRIVCLLPPNTAPPGNAPWRKLGPVYFLDLHPPLRVALAGVSFVQGGSQ